MTLHQLRIFDAVARHLNITNASAELHMSQPAVTHQLKLLEQRYGRRFYRKTAQGIALTESGLSFIAAVRPILNEIANLERQFDRSGDKRQGSLNIGGTHSLCISVLPEAIMDFKKTHPGTQFMIETDDSVAIEEQISTASLDVALITHPSYKPNLSVEPHEKLEVIAFASASSPLGGKTMSLSELAQLPLVIRKDSKILKELLLLGYKPTIAVLCKDSAAVQAAVQKGMGVGILTGDSVRSSIESGSLIRLNVPELKKIALQSFIVFDQQKPLSPIAKDFLHLLRNRRLRRRTVKRGHERFGSR
jgi:DNA-binding transcriptional LysR family regulator